MNITIPKCSPSESNSQEIHKEKNSMMSQNSLLTCIFLDFTQQWCSLWV